MGNSSITGRLADRYQEREKKELDVKLGVLSCRVEGGELVFRTLHLVKVEPKNKNSMIDSMDDRRKKETLSL